MMTVGRKEPVSGCACVIPRRETSSCSAAWHSSSPASAVRPLAREQLLVDDGQTILVAGFADLAVEGFRWRVQRRDAAEQARTILALEVLHQTEIGHFHAVADQEEIARLDVEVLEIMLFIHVVEGFRGVADVTQERVARDAEHAGILALDESVVEALVRQ